MPRFPATAERYLVHKAAAAATGAAASVSQTLLMPVPQARTITPRVNGRAPCYPVSPRGFLHYRPPAGPRAEPKVPVTTWDRSSGSAGGSRLWRGQRSRLRLGFGGRFRWRYGLWLWLGFWRGQRSRPRPGFRRLRPWSGRWPRRRLRARRPGLWRPLRLRDRRRLRWFGAPRFRPGRNRLGGIIGCFARVHRGCAEGIYCHSRIIPSWILATRGRLRAGGVHARQAVSGSARDS